MNPDDVEQRLRTALDELTRSTPLPHIDAPRPASSSGSTFETLTPPEQPATDGVDNGEIASQSRPTWRDGKVLALALGIVLVIAAIVTVGVQASKRPAHPAASTSTTRLPPTTTPPTAPPSTPAPTTSTPTPTTSTPPATTAQPPPGFTAAKAEWQQSATTYSYERPIYWSAAAADLTAAVNSGASGTEGFASAVAELQQLLSLPGNMLNPSQAEQFQADTGALNAFFGTSGLL